jgi:hypothetical protein
MDIARFAPRGDGQVEVHAYLRAPRVEDGDDGLVGEFGEVVLVTQVAQDEALRAVVQQESDRGTAILVG